MVPVPLGELLRGTWFRLSPDGDWHEHFGGGNYRRVGYDAGRQVQTGWVGPVVEDHPWRMVWVQVVWGRADAGAA